MGASPARLLPVSLLLALAGTLLSTEAAVAAPDPGASSTAVRHVVVPAAPAPSEPGSASSDRIASSDALPVGVLALLIPILLGGGTVTVVTLRRLR